MSAETLLPATILEKASFDGTEYAWHPSDIPDVIEAARQANLANLGGQLQFRLPSATCECWWIDVSTELNALLPWDEQVNHSASASLAAFQAVCSGVDFMAEGRSAFRNYFDEFEANGGDLNQTLYFVWYVESDEGMKALNREFQLG